MYHDKLHVKYSDDSVDGSNLLIHCRGNGSRSKSSSDGMCHRRLLRIRNTNRHASQHHGGGSRRLHLYGLCQSGSSADRDRDDREHDHSSNRISVLPVKDGNNGCRYNIIKCPSNDGRSEQACSSAQSLSGTILIIFHM